ncbi:hypothetical protein IAU60_004680 [Kwoniella sp. DSM 27419]
MQESLSRIAVDREPDWLRVKNNVSTSIMGLMETRLSTLAGGKDGEAAKAMRAELEKRLGKIQDKMFDMSRYNIQVNGQNYEDFVDATEGFDQALDVHLWGIQAERIKLETESAEARKTKPEVFRRVQDHLEHARADAEWLPDDAEAEEAVPRAADIPPPPRHEEVKQTFQTVVDDLAEVIKNAPHELQRAQRAQTVREQLTKAQQ